jgi:hypothetical protein
MCLVAAAFLGICKMLWRGHLQKSNPEAYSRLMREEEERAARKRERRLGTLASIGKIFLKR